MPDITEVLVPANEEGTRATILRWCKAVGDTVAKDEALVELETDKVTVEVASPANGTLIEILKQVDVEVSPDEVLARLQLTEAARAAAPSAAAGSAPVSGSGAAAPRTGTATSGTATAPDSAAPGTAASAGQAAAAQSPLSPAVRQLLREHALAPSDIEGSGRQGRITAADVERHVVEAKPVDTRRPHSAMRRRIAEHMVRSVAGAPHVTTLFEADLTRVLAHRRRHADEFERQGVRLTLTAYFIAACARALREQPEVNASFEADALVLHPECNIGVGTALGSEGLIVPVVHSAQKLSLLEIARRLGRLVAAARDGKLAPEDVRGGTFTISNHGVSGSLLASPIVINQPQVAILGVGKVQRRVCVVETGGAEAIAIRSMCYFTLTIDHRALDAFQANAFLSKIVGLLEAWPED